MFTGILFHFNESSVINWDQMTIISGIRVGGIRWRDRSRGTVGQETRLVSQPLMCKV